MCRCSPTLSIIGLVSPIMLDNLANGGTYFFFAAFAILGFLTVCKSSTSLCYLKEILRRSIRLYCARNQGVSFTLLQVDCNLN